MTQLEAAEREGCAVLEVPAATTTVAFAAAVHGLDALDALDEDAAAKLSAAEAMRRAHDQGWTVIARGGIRGSVYCHAEAFFDSMAAAEAAAAEIGCPPGSVLEWAPGLTPDQYEPGGDLKPIPLAGARLPGPRFAPPGRDLLVIDADGIETLCPSPGAARRSSATRSPTSPSVSHASTRPRKSCPPSYAPRSTGSATSRPAAWTCP